MKAKRSKFAWMIQARELEAHNVIGFVDGLLLFTKRTSKTIQHNAMYIGYHSDTMVNNIITYGADGKVFL